MAETFTPITWGDGAGGGTPITAAELNRIEQGVESMDDRVSALATSVDVIVSMTKTEYDALGAPDARTLYLITGP